jgi:hypothetical protein
MTTKEFMPMGFPTRRLSNARIGNVQSAQLEREANDEDIG